MEYKHISNKVSANKIQCKSSSHIFTIATSIEVSDVDPEEDVIVPGVIDGCKGPPVVLVSIKSKE